MENYLILVILSPKQHKTSLMQKLHKVQYKRMLCSIILKEWRDTEQRSKAQQVPWAKEPVTKPKKQRSILANSF